MISAESKRVLATSFPKIRKLKWRFEVFGRQKIFCIGRNKTGTTSITKAFQDLGYRVGNERDAYKLLPSYSQREFQPIVRYCKTAQVFQDVPFSLPYTFQVMDQAFPGSKFILTIRNSADHWVESLLNHHKRRFGKNGEIPTKADLKKLYKIPGLNRWDYEKIKYDMTEEDLYDKEFLKTTYLRHNENVLDYFRYRKEDVLVINLSDSDSYSQFCDFISEQPLYKEFPHLNRSNP